MAEHPILEAMARAHTNNDLTHDHWAECCDDLGRRVRAGQMLAALRSLAEAEPTPGMLKCEQVRRLGRSLDDEGVLEVLSGEEAVQRAGEEAATELFRAMLRALLEEVEAAHG